jgi:hypothetical protein
MKDRTDNIASGIRGRPIGKPKGGIREHYRGGTRTHPMAPNSTGLHANAWTWKSVEHGD